FYFISIRYPPGSTLLPYTTLFRSGSGLPDDAERNQYDITQDQQQGSGDRGPAFQQDVADDDGEHPSRQQNPVLHREAEGALHPRSEEHTSELQSRENLVCRLLLEK